MRQTAANTSTELHAKRIYAGWSRRAPCPPLPIQAKLQTLLASSVAVMRTNVSGGMSPRSTWARRSGLCGSWGRREGGCGVQDAL
jgi:hypothetical protein